MPQKPETIISQLPELQASFFPSSSTQPKGKEYDFFTMVLNQSLKNGKSYDPNAHLINVKSELDAQPGADVVWHDPEFLWNKNKAKYNNNREAFDQDYKNISQLYGHYKKNELDYYDYTRPKNHYTALGLTPVGGVGLILDKKPMADYGWMSKFDYNLTPSEMAASTGKYLNRQGEWKELDWSVKYNPFKPLVVEQDDKGDYFIRETGLSEDLVNQQMYSFWGSQSKYGNAILNTVGGFLSELIPGTVDSFAKLGLITNGSKQSIIDAFKDDNDKELLSMKNGLAAADMYGDIVTGNAIFGQLTDYLFDKVLPNGKKDALHAISNLANRMKFQTSEEAERAGWFGSMEGFMTNLGKGLSYLVPQRGAAVGVAKLLTKAGSKGLIKAASTKLGRELTEKEIEHIVKSYKFSPSEMSAINMAGFGTGTIQAMSGVYTTAKQHGLSDAEASWMSIAASPFVYVTEKTVGGGWLWKELQTVEGKGLWKSEISKWLKHELKENGFQSAKELTEKNYINIGKNAISGFISGSKDAGFKSFRYAKDLPGIGSGIKEGTQEFLEESLYVGEEMVFDQINKIAGKDAAYNTEMFSDETLNRLRDSWLGGFFIGGVADAYLHRGRAKDQNDAITDAIISGKTEDLKGYINDLYKKGDLGQTHLSETGEVITKNQTGKVKSMNDVNYQNILQQIDFYENLYKAGGLNTKEMIDAVGGDVNLVKEGMDNLLAQYNINSELNDLNTQRQKNLDSGLSSEQIDKDISSKQQELDKLKSDYKDLGSGKRLADVTKESLIKNRYNQVGDIYKGADVVTSKSQDEFNKTIPDKKKQEIERLKAERDKIEAERVTAGNVVNKFAQMDVSSLDREFADTLSKIKQYSEQGLLSQEDSQKIVQLIEQKKSDTIAFLEKTFNEETLLTVREAAMEDLGEGPEFNQEQYVAKLLTKARIAPTLRTNVMPGDVVQQIDKDGNPLGKEVPVVGVNEDGSLILDQVADAIQPSEVKNITAQNELNDETDLFNKRSEVDNAFQSLSGIRNKYVDLNEAYGYNDDIFTSMLYSSVDENGIPVPIENVLRRISGIAPEQAQNMTAEQYQEALKNSPMLQLPETKTALENIVNVLKNSMARLDMNWNVYNKLDRKMSGLTDENTLSKDQFFQTSLYQQALLAEAEGMLRVLGGIKLNRETRQSVFRQQDLKISTYLMSESIKHMDQAEGLAFGKLLTDIQKEIEILDKSKAEGKQISNEDYIKVKKLVSHAETQFHDILLKKPDIANKIIQDLITYHDIKISSYIAAAEFSSLQVDDLLNVGNFSTPANNNQNFKDNQAYLKQFLMFYMVNYYQNISRLSSNEFASAFKSVASELSDIDNIPSFEQESIIKHIVSFLNNPKDGLIEFSNSKVGKGSMNNFLWNALFVRGFYGTGKTTTIGKLALKTFSKLNGKKAKVIVVAPNQRLANRLSGEVANEASEVRVMTNSDFLSQGAGVVNSYDIVLIDEASRLSKPDLNRINEILTGKSSNNSIKAIMMGDQSQMQSVKEAEKRLPIEYRIERTMPATEIYRSGIEDIWLVLESLRIKMRSLSNDFVIPPTKYSKDKSRGVYQIPSTDVALMMKEFSDDILANPDHAQNTAIVTFRAEDRVRIINTLLANSELVSKLGESKIGAMVYHLDEGDQNAQGHQFERVYVAINRSMMPTNTQADVILSRALLTAGSRATNYMVLGMDGASSSVGPVITVLPDTPESRKQKLDNIRKWYEWALNRSSGGTKTDDQTIKEDTVKAKSSKTKGKPQKGFWAVNDKVFTNPGDDTSQEASSLRGRTGNIISFVLKPIMGDNQSPIRLTSYEEWKKGKPGYSAFIEVMIDGDKASTSKFADEFRRRGTRLILSDWIETYNDSKAKKQADTQAPSNQNDVKVPDLSKYGMAIGDLWKNKVTGNVAKLTRAFYQGNNIMLVFDGKEESPVKRTVLIKNAEPVKQTTAFNKNDEEVEPSKNNTSQLLASKNRLTFGLLSNQGAENQDDPVDDYVRFKKELLSFLGRNFPAPVTLSFVAKTQLASATGIREFSNVVEVRYNNMTDLQAIQKKLGTKVDLNKASLVGTLPNPKLLYGNHDLVNNSNYALDSDVQKLLNLVAGATQTETDLNRFLINIRQQLATKGAMSVSMTSMKYGGLEYVESGRPMIPVSELVRTLERKGFIVDTDNMYFDNTLKRNNGTSFASVILSVKAGQGLPESRIYVNTPTVDDAYFKSIQDEVSQLKKLSGLTWKDIDNSTPFKFLLFNTSRIAQKDQIIINGLDEFMEVKDEGWVDLKGTKPSEKLESLRNTINLLDEYFKQNKFSVSSFNQLAGKRTEKGTYIVDYNPDYLTTVTNIGFPQGELDVTAIKQAIDTISKSSVPPSSTGRKPIEKPKFRRTKVKPDLLNNDEKRELREAVVRYYERIFGKDFLEGRLEFERNLIYNDDQLYGMVKNAKVILEETEKGIEIHTKRHEASHFALNYLISPETRRRLLDDAKSAISENTGEDIAGITDEVADEYISERYEKRYEGIGGLFNRLIDRFNTWVSRLFSNLELYQEDVDGFLYAIETGRFKDQAIYDNDADFVATKKKPGKGNVTRMQQFGDMDDSSSGSLDAASEMKDFSDLRQLLDEDWDPSEDVDTGYADNDQDAANKKQEQDKTLNYSSLIAVFGNADNLNLVRRKIVTQILESSNWDRNIDIQPMPLIPVIDEIRNQYKAWAAQTPLKLSIEGTDITTLAEINGTNASLLTEEQFDDFVTYKLADDMIFNTIVKKIFPNMNFKKQDLGLFDKKENNEHKNEVWTTEEDLSANNELNINNKNDEKDPFSRMGSHIHFHLNNMRMNAYTYDQDGNPVYQGKSDKFVSVGHLRGFISQAAIDAQLPSNDQESSDFFERFVSNIRGMAKAASIARTEGDNTSYIADTLWSFYHTFLSNRPVSYTENDVTSTEYSHFYLSNYKNELLNNYPEYAENINVKAIDSQNILSAFIVFFQSLRRNSFTQANFVQRDGTMNVSLESSVPHEVAKIKNEINAGISNYMFVKSLDAQPAINPSFAELFEGKKKVFNVQVYNIFMHQYNAPLLNVKYSQGLPVFEFSPNVKIDDIMSAFNKLGVNRNYANIRTIKFFYNNDNKTGKLDTDYTRQNLAEILGMYLFSSFSAVTEGPHQIKTVVNNYYKKKGLVRDSVYRLDDPNTSATDDIKAKQTSQKSDAEFPDKPTDLFNLTGLLARGVNYTSGKELSNFYQSVKGTRKMLWVNKAFSDLFLYNSTSDEFVSSRLKANKGKLMAYNPAVAVLPYMDQKSSSGIIKVESLDGGIDAMERGKELGRMNERELSDMSIHGFVNGVLNSQGTMEKLVVPFHNIADKDIFKIVHATMQRSDTDRFMQKKGDQWSVNKSILVDNVGRIFAYFNQVRASSIEKMYESLVRTGMISRLSLAFPSIDEMVADSNSLLIQQKMLELWELAKANPEAMNTYKEFVKFVKKESGMKLTKDFILMEEEIGGITEEFIMPGKAINFNYYGLDSLFNSTATTSVNPQLFEQYLRKAQGHPIFNAYNSRRLFSEIAPEIDRNQEIYDRLKDIFGHHYKRFTDFLRNNRHEIPSSIANVMLGPDGNPTYRKIGIDITEKTIDVEGEGITTVTREEVRNDQKHRNWDWHPFYEGFFFTYILNDIQLSTMLMGDYSHFNNYTDFLKRSSQLEAPGMFPDTSNPMGIGTHSKIAIFNDPKNVVFKELNAFRASKGLPAAGKYEAFNGAGFVNPVWYALLNNSFGGSIGSLGFGVLKPVYNEPGMYLKMATTVITGQMAEKSPEIMTLLDKMFISNELRSMFAGFIAENQELPFATRFSQAVIRMAEYIAANGFHDQIISQMIPTTSVKDGAQNINELNDASYTTVTIDNSFYRIQTNLEQEIEETQLSNYNQLYALMGIGQHNTDRVERLNRIQEQIARNYMAYLEREIRKLQKQSGGIRREGVMRLLKKMGIDATQNIDDTGFYVELMNDPNASIEIPVLRAKLKQYLANRITQNAIKPKMNGVRHNQSPSALYKVYDLPNGEVVMYDELVRRGINVASVTARNLRPMTIQGSQIIPAEVLMPYSYFKEFGIDPSWTLNQTREFIASQGNPDLLKTFEQTLKVVIGRIPANSAGSAFVGQIVGFINDASNTIVFPEEHNVITSADYDGDQVNVYFYGLSRDENGFVFVNNNPADNSKTSLQNRITDTIFEYFADPMNADFIFTPIELQSFTKELEEQLHAVEQTKGSYAANTPQAFFFMSRMINEGKNMVGRFANAIKTYSFLTQAFNSNNKRNRNTKVINLSSFPLTPDGKTPSGYVVEFMGRLLQASVDNAKELILGALGVDMNNGNILTAMAVDSLSPKQAFEFFSRNHVRHVFRRMYFNNTLGDYRTNDYGQKWNMFDQINETIDMLQDPNNDFIIVEEDAEFRNLVNRQSKETRIVSDEETGDTFHATENVFEDNYTEYLNNPQSKLDDVIGRRTLARQKAIEDLKQLSQYEIKGQALFRLTQAIGYNSKGMPVFEYDMDKNVRNLSYILNQDLSNLFVNNPKPVDENYWKSHIRTLSKDGMEVLSKREKSIRKVINISEVLNLLPHSKYYVETLNWLNDLYAETFIHDSKFVKSLERKFMDSVGKNVMDYENGYKQFHIELEKFQIALYFDQFYSSPDMHFENLFSLMPNVGKINIGSPEGRVMYGYQFPKYIYNEFLEQTNNNEIIRNEWQGNTFIERLQFNQSNNGMFIELRDSTNITDDQMAQLRNDFEKLPSDLKEKFAVYFMMKDGFIERKGSIMKVMGAKTFDRYSVFAENLHNAVAQADQGVEILYTLGNGNVMPISKVFEEGFSKDVPYYLRNLLYDENKLIKSGIEKENYPKLMKTTQKKGQYTEVALINSENPDISLTSRYTSIFNPYSPGRTTLITGKSLKVMNWDDFVSIKTKSGKGWDSYKGQRISFKGITSFKVKDKVAIIDGSMTSVTQVNQDGSVYLRPDSQTNVDLPVAEMVSEKEWKERLLGATNTYKGVTSKKEALNLISIHSMNHYYRDLAKAIIASPRIKESLEMGSIMWEQSTHTIFVQANPGAPNLVTAAFDPKTRNIYVNTDNIESPYKLERSILHEFLHDLTLRTIRKSSADRTPQEQRFVDELNNLYQEALAADARNGRRFRIALSNIEEFITYSMTNSDFQEFLSNVESSVNVDFNPTSLWGRLLETLANFFSGPTGENFVSGSVLGNVLKVTSNFLTNPPTQEDFNKLRSTFVRMAEISDKEVEELMKNCK